MEDQADKYRQQKKHNGLLMVAASRGYLADAEALTEMGAALGCKDKKGRCPMHFAAAKGRLEVVRFLWSRGAEVDAETPEGRTPLHLAALGGHADVATFLLQKGAWAEAYDSQDNTPLHLAARQGHTEVMEVLARHGAKTGPENKQGLTAMGQALVGGHVAAAKLLQSWGAGLSDRPHGYSLLHLSAGMAQPASVSFLLDSGADANDRGNAEGASPLHSAALGDCLKSAQALLAAGADPGVADAEGRLPADLAPQQTNRLCELLKPKSRPKPAGGAPAQAGRTGADSLALPKTAQDIFQAMTEAERRGKVERWALLEAADLAAALRQYPPDAAAEATDRIAQLLAARKLLNIHKALAALHADDDFQADAAQAHVREAIDAIRADTSKYDRYAADPQILTVLQKMRRLHAVVQANGQRTISIDEMLTQPGQEKKDADRQVAIEATCSAHLAAAAAAAAAPAGSAQSAAQAAYDESLHQSKELASGKKGQGQGPVASAAAKLVGAGTSAAAVLRQRLGGGGGEGGAGAASAAAGTAGSGGTHERSRAQEAARVLEEAERRPEDDEADLPEWLKGGFSWKKVGLEFWRQMVNALLMLAIFLVGSWVLRGRPPWVA